MNKRILDVLAFAMSIALLGASISPAALWMPGNFQVANGAAGDWNPGTAPQFTDLTGEIYELPLTGLTDAVSLTRYQSKILDDQGSPPANWGDPEVGGGNANTWFVTDATGSVTVTVDRNTYDDGFLPATDRIFASTDATEFSSFFATGNWEDVAGGSTNFSGNDPLFQMTDQGSGLWSVDATITTPGSYEFMATANGSFDFQWGTNGRIVDNVNKFQFITVAADQVVTFSLDVSKGAIGFSTDTFLDGDTDGDGIIELEDDFGPIRDNWLNNTFLRAEGNIDNTGDSEGVVDIADFRQWKNAFNGPPALIAEAFASLSVPEPSSAVLIVLAGMLMVGKRRNRG